MNAYDHHDYRRDIERMDQQRRAERAAYRETLRRKLPDPETMPRDGSWQLDFLVRFIVKAVCWGLLIYWLLGAPTIPIRWLQ